LAVHLSGGDVCDALVRGEHQAVDGVPPSQSVDPGQLEQVL
jgi:hypothetical protein